MKTYSAATDSTVTKIAARVAKEGPLDLSVNYSANAADIREALAARGVSMGPSDKWMPGIEFYRFAPIGAAS